MDLHSYFKSASSSHQSCSTSIDSSSSSTSSSSSSETESDKSTERSPPKGTLYLYIKGSSEVLNCVAVQ